MLKKYFAILLLCSCIQSQAQEFSFEKIKCSNPLLSATDTQVHQLAENFYRTVQPPGLLIGISRNGVQTYYSYGKADTATDRAFTSSTVFEAGSISKTFTANLVLQLAALKWLDIHQSLLHYIPVQGNDSVLGSIVLETLLTHTSGLPRLPANMDKVKGFSANQPYRYTREYLYPYLQTLKKPKPGTYTYSNLGFGLLSTILENCSSLSYESLLNRFILQPLKMDHTYISSPKSKADTATGYYGGKSTPYWDFDCLAGLGAIKTTAGDMLTYLDAHHLLPAPGEIKKAINQVIQPRIKINNNLQIGYAWHTFEQMPERVTWHNGGTYGFCTFAAFEPVTHTSLILVTNQFGANAAADKLGVELMQYLLAH